MSTVKQSLLSAAIAGSLVLLQANSQVNAQSTHYKSSAPSVTAIDGLGVPVGGFGRLFPLYAGEQTDRNAFMDSEKVVHYLLEHPSHRIELLRLAEGMIEKSTASVEGNMPLAHVFFGQFVDHDITLDTISNFDSLAGNVTNARTPDLDLDCIYGAGREASPFLYTGPYLRVGAMTVDAGDRLFNRYDLLRIPVPPSDLNPSASPVDTVAVIGDPRNDENFAVAQIQAAFIAYHNRMVDRVIERELEAEKTRGSELIASLTDARDNFRDGLDDSRSIEEVLDSARNIEGFNASASQLAKSVKSDFLNVQAQRVKSVQEFAYKSKGDLTKQDALAEVLVLAEYALEQNEQELANLRANKLASPRFVAEVFEEARDLTIHHYHRVIMEDFLPRIISGKRVLDMMEKGRNFYFPSGFQPGGEQPYIPIEFSVAAYRFAHSQVPGRFEIRKNVSSALFRGAKDNLPGDLLPRGFTPIRTSLTVEGGAESATNSLVIDWGKLIDVNDTDDPDHALALRIDTLLSSPLETLDIPGITPKGALGNLAARNLSRGRTYRLPSGQDLARIITSKLAAQGSLGAYSGDPQNASALIIEPDTATSKALITSETPLWYYIIQEASCFKAADDNAADFPMAVARVASESTGVGESTGESKSSGTDCTGGGNVLGPVGGTIVGEVLWGLVDHYRANTGSGIDLNVELDYCVAGNEDPSCKLDLGDRDPDQFLSNLSETDQAGSRRYLLVNFLRDAGVTSKIDESVTVCESPAYLPSDAC